MNRASAGAYEDDVAAMADAGVVVDFLSPAVASGNDFVWTVDGSAYEDTPEFYIDISYHLEDSVITGKDYNDIPKYFTFYTDAACRRYCHDGQVPERVPWGRYGQSHPLCSCQYKV